MTIPRILFLDQTGQIGGAELFLADAAEHHRDACRVALFENGPFRRLLEERGVPVSVLGLASRALAVTKTGSLMGSAMAGPHLGRLALRIARLAHDADLIYANTAKAMIVGSMASVLSRVPLLYHLHDFLSAEHFSAWNRRVLMAFSRRAAAVIANSEAVRRAFVGQGGRPETTRVVYNGFDIGRYGRSDETASADSRQALGIGSSPCLLMAGRLTSWKGQHVLLEALRLLPGVHAVIAGDALFNEGDRRYAEELRAAAREGDLAGRVHFIGFQHDLLSWYRMADMIVHASIAPEPFGRVIVEGMLAGKPVLATFGGGVGEIISDRVTGYMATPGDPRALAEAVKLILADPAEASAIAERGRRDARERFSKEAAMAAWDRVIGNVASCKNRNRSRVEAACRRAPL